MDALENKWRGKGLPEAALKGIPALSIDADAPRALLARCPAAALTPLVVAEGFGPTVWVKDERGRMNLGSFKALGAAYVIAHEADAAGASDMALALQGRTYVTASAGNHGLSVAAGAAAFGAASVVYLADTVPESFAGRLRDKGAKVVRFGASYEQSVEAAMMAAEENGWTLLSDTSWEGYTEIPHRLMEGYLAMAAEAVEQCPEVPTHIFLQAGVGGLAGAAAAYFRKTWGDAPRIIVVEPEAAPALHASIKAGESVVTEGPVSAMGRLDCKEPSMIALKGLARDADAFVLISEEESAAVLPKLEAVGLASTASGAAGLAAMMLSDLPVSARALCVLSEVAD
ncbi:MAG: pyridoxal-phosphate dependent enzyme [Roseovarius sp.]